MVKVHSTQIHSHVGCGVLMNTSAALRLNPPPFEMQPLHLFAARGLILRILSYFQLSVHPPLRRRSEDRRVLETVADIHRRLPCQKSSFSNPHVIFRVRYSSCFYLRVLVIIVLDWVPSHPSSQIPLSKLESTPHLVLFQAQEQAARALHYLFVEFAAVFS